MRFSYYNLDKDDLNKKHSRFKKKKLFTICFNHILEDIQFENSDRGILLWINTPKNIRVFGYWKQGGCASREIAQHFGKYFGMLITEAKYADIVDFEVIEEKYKI